MRVVDCLYIDTDGGSTGVEGMAWMAIVALVSNPSSHVCVHVSVCVCMCEY